MATPRRPSTVRARERESGRWGALPIGNILPIQANTAIGRAPVPTFPALPVHPSLTRPREAPYISRDREG